MKNGNSVSNSIIFFLIALGWSCSIWIVLIPTIQNSLGLHLNPAWA